MSRNRFDFKKQNKTQTHNKKSAKDYFFFFPQSYFSRADELPEAANRIAEQTLALVLLKEKQHTAGAWGLEVEQEYLH